MKPVAFPQVKADYRALAGGLDLVTPRIALDPGKLYDAQNYEPMTVGGYRRINGYERYDGRPGPTAAPYWVLFATLTGTVAVGASLAGATSLATGKVLAVIAGTPATIVLGRVSGTFVSGEALKVLAATVGAATSAATQRGATQASDDADWRLLAANDLRADIGTVPGQGAVRGVFLQDGILYAFRDNVGATASLLYKATSTGWTQVPFKRRMKVGVRKSLFFDVSAAAGTPGVITWNAHGLEPDDAIQFTAVSPVGSTLPAPLALNTTYYVRTITTNTFTLATAPGGTAMTTTGSTVACNLMQVGSPGFSVGNPIGGVATGATATVLAAPQRTGNWNDGTAEQTLVLDTLVGGPFANYEALRVAGRCIGQVIGTDSAITRSPGGTVETVSSNFQGSFTSKRTYGVDGVNQAFEFDGTTYVPIATGMAFDAPTRVIEFRNYLWLAFGASLQFSGIGNPYSWSIVLGAGEIKTGDNVSGFAQLAATQAGSALGVFTDGRHYTLYGTSAANWVMVTSNTDIGFAARTIQQVSNNSYGMTARGIQSLITTLNYGDFEYAAVSFFIEPLINAKMGLAIASVALKNKNQYRVFFSDGTALAVGLTGEKIAGILPLNYGKPVRCICNATLASGQEVTYFGSDDGYVYQDNVGTSFDGQPIEAWVRPAFNNLRSPRVRKQYRRAIFELVCEGYTQINIGYDLGYANPDANPPATSADQKISQKVNIAGSGGFWDQYTWEGFVWDTPVVNTADVPLDGSENNIGFLAYSSRAQDDPHTLQGVNLLYTPRRLVHSGS